MDEGAGQAAGISIARDAQFSFRISVAILRLESESSSFVKTCPSIVEIS